MKITIEGSASVVKPASCPGDVIKVLLLSTASTIAQNLKNGVDKAEAAAQFGKRLEALILAGALGEVSTSHVVQ